MNWLALIQLILGAAEQIVPVFIHNPKSQQVEGVIVTTANNALTMSSTLAAATAPAATAGAQLKVAA